MNNQKIEKLLKKFPPQNFTSNPIENVLKENESKVILLLRNEKNAESYNGFDTDFDQYLNKLPTSLMKKYVSNLFTNNLVFIGTAKNTDITTLSRVLITTDDKLAGVVLNAYALDIKLTKGETPQIDECIYATYAGIIRAACLTRKTEIRRDKDLHKSMTTFLFLLFLKMLGKQMTVAPQQKTLLHLVCIYLYYRHFLQEKHSTTIMNIERDYVGDLIQKDLYEQLKDKVDKLVSFDSMKDISRIIYDYHIAQLTPQQILMMLIKTVGQSGFYALIGSLDGLVAAAILSKYPTELISKNLLTSNDVHDTIETLVSKHIDKIVYASSIFEFKE